MDIHNLYSNRNASKPEVFIYDHLPKKLKVQITLIWKDFNNKVVIGRSTRMSP
jgi:hypothetical protein